MDKIEAINAIQQKYPDLKIYSIVEIPDMFVAQMTKKNGEAIIGGTKCVNKKTGKVEEINPLRHKGLVDKLMSKPLLIKQKR